MTKNSRRPRRKFDSEAKAQAVADYVSGRKTAEQVALENGVTRSMIYQWRVQSEEASRGAKAAELEALGLSPQEARRIQQLEDENAEFRAKVAEQAIIIDLLKKLRMSTSYQPESELTGLIAISKNSARSKKRGF
jgi:transposase-like protein